MRYPRVWLGAVLIAVMGVGLIATSGLSQNPSSNPIPDRQRIMKLIGANWADIQAKVKAGQIEAIAVNAETIAMVSSHIPALFPANSLAENSNAKPEIWQNWAQFQELTKQLEGRAVSLRDAAKAKDAAAVDAQVKEFGIGRASCKGKSVS